MTNFLLMEVLVLTYPQEKGEAKRIGSSLQMIPHHNQQRQQKEETKIEQKGTSPKLQTQ